ncbi:MAG: DUF2125 domain-containing protein [Pseudomonadota bacterium]
MTVFFRRSCGAAIVYAIATQGAWADLTAQDVWTDWQDYMTGMGYEISGAEATSGGATTISDIVMSMKFPEDEGEFRILMPEMTLTENGDGTVAIGLPTSFPLTFEVTPGDEAPVKGVMTYSHQGLVMTASGEANDMTYDYTADSVTLEMTSLEAEGESLPAGALKMVMTVGKTTGMSRMIVGEMREVTQSMDSDDVKFDIAFEDPDSDEGATIAGTMQGLSFAGGGVIPKEFDAANYQSMLDAGFNFSGGFSYSSGSTNMSGMADGAPFAFASSSQGGDFKVSMDSEHVGYDVKQTGSKISVTTSDLPFPVELAMAEAGFKFEIPVQAGDQPQPFAFGLSLVDFTMSDLIWSMFDPAGALPRDPATISLDTDGTAKVLVNFLDPAVAETLDSIDAAPGELNSLNVNSLLISLVGAQLSADGAFEFDNSNLEAFDGMPAPSGVANLTLVGANGLIDKLIGMGMMSDSDAMGARMMMGMLAVPGDSPDTLTSTIEINKQGHIIANGQRIQ